MNVILLWFTKRQICAINGKYIRTQNVTVLGGENQEIAVFSGENTLYTGQCTLVRTIIIHESVFEDEQRFNYIITHEIAHKKQWWGILFIPLWGVCFVGAIIFLVAALNAVIQTIKTGNLVQLIFFPLGLIIALLFIAIACAFSRFMELNADFQSIKKLGLQTYLDVMNKPSRQKRSRSQKVIYWMTHPPKNVTIWFWQRLHKSY